MLTDRYDQPLSTNSSAARDAYVEACDIRLIMYPGAVEGFDRALAADPGFALASAGKAYSLLERGEGVQAREAIDAAKAHLEGVTPREASHVAIFDLLVSGDSQAALAAVYTHLERWPRDVMVLATTAFTNGLIASSGRAGQKRALLQLLERLAPHYGEDDWWFGAHHGMALSENGQREAARPMIERSLAQNSKNPWAAHASAHLCYEEGEYDRARAFMAEWLTSYPREAPLYSHLIWHLVLAELEAGHAEAALRLYRTAVAPDVHSGPPRGRVTDAVSFLWRWELAGNKRDPKAWRLMHELAANTFPRAGAAFCDMHIALTLAVAGNEVGLAERGDQINALDRAGRYPSGPMVPAVARGFAAFERGDFAAAIEAIEPLAEELERLGGSRAQLDLVEFTLLKAYIEAGRLDHARGMLGSRRRGGPRIPVSGLPALTN